MQTLQHLPAHLLANILKHLSTQDILRARLVCKDFIRLDQLVSLKLNVQTQNAEAASSLMLFTSRHCATTSSPRIALKVHQSSGTNMWPGIALAASCANLRRLNCSYREMDLSVAQACLRLVPDGLESLDIFAPTVLVNDASWGRLAALTSLSMDWPAVAHSQNYSGSGIMSLTSLIKLGISENNRHTTDKLDGSSFSMRSLTELQFGVNPFAGRPDLVNLPKLECIGFFSHASLPKWLEGQNILKLLLHSSEVLKGFTPSLLMCVAIEVIYAEGDPGWQLSALLEMPLLKSLVVAEHGSVASPMPIVGSQAEYLKFMKLDVDLDVPAELHISSPHAAKCKVKLWGNGHTVVCVCADCQAYEEDGEVDE